MCTSSSLREEGSALLVNNVQNLRIAVMVRNKPESKTQQDPETQGKNHRIRKQIYRWPPCLPVDNCTTAATSV